MSLTDAAIRNAKPQNKQYKLSDEKGMHPIYKKPVGIKKIPTGFSCLRLILKVFHPGST